MAGAIRHSSAEPAPRRSSSRPSIACAAAGYVHLGPHNPPPGANLKRVEFCAVSGQLAGPFCQHRIEGWFIPGISPITSCNVHREVFIDAATGMRLPAPDGRPPGQAREFTSSGPSDLMRLFREAGLPRRRPPPFLPGSRAEPLPQPGNAPQIVSPRPGAVYEMQAW